MKTLALVETEATLLLELLESAHRAKLHELHHTSTKEYAHRLRAEAETIEHLRAKLKDAAPPTG